MEYRLWLYDDGTAAIDRPDGRQYLDEDQTRYLLAAFWYAPCINTKAAETIPVPEPHKEWPHIPAKVGE